MVCFLCLFLSLSLSLSHTLSLSVFTLNYVKDGDLCWYKTTLQRYISIRSECECPTTGLKWVHVTLFSVSYTKDIDPDRCPLCTNNFMSNGAISVTSVTYTLFDVFLFSKCSI